ncbi:hypothetical protein V5O48_007654 [Marasmius crinis-equi]|uniref:Uncharacterized protein n=1 Tax=Marasmius crinis-equi TaxID=585013 RepID=A0ABR3FG61_9AGAR
MTSSQEHEVPQCIESLLSLVLADNHRFIPYHDATDAGVMKSVYNTIGLSGSCIRAKDGLESSQPLFRFSSLFPVPRNIWCRYTRRQYRNDAWNGFFKTYSTIDYGFQVRTPSLASASGATSTSTSPPSTPSPSPSTQLNRHALPFVLAAKKQTTRRFSIKRPDGSDVDLEEFRMGTVRHV